MSSSATQHDGRLVLEDGSIFRGQCFGATRPARAVTAEVVFNTALTGYQESLTDPSYTGQILTMTAPMIGVYGSNDEDTESGAVRVSGFIVRELVESPSNQRSTRTLTQYLADEGILGLTGVDTRALTRRLRTAGAMRGAICSDPTLSDEELLAQVRSAPSMAGQDLATEAGAGEKSWSDDLGDWRPGSRVRSTHADALHVLAIDCGAKRNILRNLVETGCRVTLIAPDTPASEIQSKFDAGEIDGLFISNGPGDPAAVETTVGVLRELLGAAEDRMVPTFGICLGFQLLALAAGAETYKLKFGHRGANQPVKNLLTGRVEITSQNHGFAVDPASLEAAGGDPTHIHLNDGVICGFRLRDKPVFGVQHHPEASPGPHDASYLFDAFVQMMQTRRPLEAT